jgi:purine nucleoside phosphorylase
LKRAGRISHDIAGSFPAELRYAAETAVVIGSGLSPEKWPGTPIADIDYSDMEGMAVPSVEGHPGRLLLLDTGKGKLLVFAGRTHYYEGTGWEAAGCTAAAAAGLGCRRIILTQAAGSLKRSLPVGSWLLPSGIVSLPWKYDPPAGTGRPVISTRLRELVASAAAGAGIDTMDGTLYWTAGPVYETPAEGAAAALAGADAATMSPLPELAAAEENGLEAACLSYITNFAPNVSKGATGHMEVLEAGRKGAESLFRLLPYLVKM